MALDIHLLGPPNIFHEATPVPLRGQRPIALLAYLVRQNPCDESYEHFHELLALQRSAAPMRDSPSYREITQRLQPSELPSFSSERRAIAEALGRNLDLEATLADLRQRFERQVK